MGNSVGQIIKLSIQSLIAFLLLVSAAATALPKTAQKSGSSNCKTLLVSKARPLVTTHQFIAQVRGEPLVVRYETNWSRLDKSQPVYLILPGLNMPSMTEKLMEFGRRGVAAVSLDLLNIGDVGPLDRPTPDEDAQIVGDLLGHLHLDQTFQPIVVVGHSRGALIANRLIVGERDRFQWRGVIQVNPYVGWIPHYYADKHAGNMGQWVKSSKSFFHPLIPGAHFMLDLMAEWTVATGQWMNRSALEAMTNLHSPVAVRSALAEVLGESDEAVLERIRQKLLGMENSEVLDDLEFLIREKIPVVFILSDQDEFVPFDMAESVRKKLGLSGWVFEGEGHYLPYQKMGEVTDLILEQSQSWLKPKHQK